MKNLDKANKWLQRAKSNMARAKAGRVSPEILYEDLWKMVIFVRVQGGRIHDRTAQTQITETKTLKSSWIGSETAGGKNIKMKPYPKYKVYLSGLRLNRNSKQI